MQGCKEDGCWGAGIFASIALIWAINLKHGGINRFHDPLIGIGKHNGTGHLNLPILAELNFKAGHIQQFQLLAELSLGEFGRMVVMSPEYRD